jgi:hypothetical protein
MMNAEFQMTNETRTGAAAIGAPVSDPARGAGKLQLTTEIPTRRVGDRRAISHSSSGL